MKIENCIQQFKIDYQFRLKARTINTYCRDVKEFLDEMDVSLSDVKKRDIRSWINNLSEKGYKANTIHSKLIGVRKFLKYCWEEGYLSVNPAEMVIYPKKGDATPYYLTRDQLTKLRKFVEGNIPERAIVEVLFATGIRISELAKMKVSDINWDETCIRIPDGKGNKGRIVPFTHECAEHLKAYLDWRTDELPFVFVNATLTKPIRRQKVNEQFNVYSKQLEFYITPHVLRHTFAAHLAQRGMPLCAIKKLLGHDRMDTTQIYARLYGEAQKEMYDEWM